MPIAEIRPLRSREAELRPFGLAKGQVVIQPEFFDPLPPELLDTFEGKAKDDPGPESR